MRHPLATLFMVVLVVFTSTYAQARALDRRTQMYFRELVIRGERPEIVGCIVAARGHMSDDPRFDAIRWEDDVSEKAQMNESESRAHLKRSVRFEGEARVRDPHAILETWQPVEISCEQLDEATPRVGIRAITP